MRGDPSEPGLWMYFVLAEVVLVVLASARFWPLPWTVMLLVLNGALVLIVAALLAIACAITVLVLLEDDDD